jgi:hypothetical protein
VVGAVPADTQWAVFTVGLFTVGRRGLEPRTYGLKVHSSAIELAARDCQGTGAGWAEGTPHRLPPLFSSSEAYCAAPPRTGRRRCRRAGLPPRLGRRPCPARAGRPPAGLAAGPRCARFGGQDPRGRRYGRVCGERRPPCTRVRNDRAPGEHVDGRCDRHRHNPGPPRPPPVRRW